MADFYSPYLENLKKSLLVQGWYESPYSSLFKEQYERLTSPTQVQNQINLARANIAGQTRAGIQEAQRALGSRGFLPGQSGVADRSIQNVLRSAQATLGETVGNILAQAQQQEAARAQAATNLLGALREADLQTLATAGGLEAQQQRFGLDELMGLLQMLYGSYAGEQAQQLARWSPYWEALAAVYKG